jgi:hypothetical protein
VREVTGDVKLVAIGKNFAIEAPGLHKPALLLPQIDGTPLPDLTPYVGQTIYLTAALEAFKDHSSINELRLHPLELYPSFEIGGAPPPPGPLFGVITGRLGSAPESNKGGDYFNASLAYHSVPGAERSASWIKLTARSYTSIVDLFSQLEAGAAIVTYGQIETYATSENKDRAQLVVRGFSRLSVGSPVQKPTNVLISNRAAAGDDAIPDSALAGSDAFVEG